jgi:hypothetical protein
MRLLIKRGSDEYPANRPGAMMVADAAAARRNQVPLGIAYMVGSTAMFAGGNAVVKWQLATYPLGEAVLVPRGQRAVARLGDGARLKLSHVRTSSDITQGSQ